MAVVNASISPASNLEYALHYASLGWGVFPAHTIKAGVCSCSNPDCTSPGKHPRTKNGLKDATIDRYTIMKWWNKFPDANIAIRTGKESGIVVLDIDTKQNGFESLEALENTFHELPETLTAVTGSKGNHICFSHPGGKLKTRCGILDGIDFRGDGGYVIAPPSLHISEHSYYWIDLDKRLEGPPTWLIDLVNGTSGKQLLEHQEFIPEGKRNSSLMSIAGKKWSDGISKSALRILLLEENQLKCLPPLPHEEVIGVYNRVITYKRDGEKFLYTWKDQFRKSDLSSSCKLVLHALADHMNSQGRSCYPTQKQLAEETSLTIRTVGKGINHCTQLGWIDRYPHRLEGQKFWNYGYIARIPDGK